MLKKLNNQLKSKYLFYAFSLLLICYVLIRAYVLSPLHDEVATFFHFIETGEIWGENAMLDANNHLINSLWGRLIYVFFGDNTLLYRSLSVFSLFFYIIACWKLANLVQSSQNKWLLFLGLTCIPWILDYFSYSRGYATAITAYLWAIVFLIKFVHTQKIHYYLAIVFLVLFCVASNLTYLVNSLLIIFTAIISFLFFTKKKTSKQVLQISSLTVLYFMGLYPLLAFSLKLKEAGALYYGSLDGFWLVSIRTLAENVLFNKEEYVKFFLLTILTLLLISYLIQHKSSALKEVVKLPESIILILLIGNVSAIFLMANLFKINYPEDRAAMYLVPLFILFFSYVSAKQHAYYLLILLFFPISLIWNINFNTSVFSPEDRIDTTFFEKLKQRILPHETLSVYPIQSLTYAYLSRKNNHFPIHFAKSEEGIVHVTDILVTKKSMLKFQKNIVEYKPLFYDKSSNHIAFERKKPFRKQILVEKKLTVISSNGEFLPIFEDSILPLWRKKPLEIEINGLVNVNKSYKTLNLVINTVDKGGNSINYHAINLRWYYGKKLTNIKLHYPFPFGKLSNIEHKIKVYLWNRDLIDVQLKNPTIKLISLN